MASRCRKRRASSPPLRIGCRFRSSPRPTAWAASIWRMRCRSASSAATAPIRQTRPAGTPTSCSPSGLASTTARRPRRSRSGRAGTKLSARPRHSRRRAHVPAPAPGRARSPLTARGRARVLARRHPQMESRLGGVHAAQFRHPCLADPARAGGGRLPGGVARRRDPRLRRGREPQLVHAVLEGAAAADHAQLLGLLRHGLRRRRHSRRQAGGARPASR